MPSPLRLVCSCVLAYPRRRAGTRSNVRRAVLLGALVFLAAVRRPPRRRRRSAPSRRRPPRPSSTLQALLKDRARPRASAATARTSDRCWRADCAGRRREHPRDGARGALPRSARAASRPGRPRHRYLRRSRETRTSGGRSRTPGRASRSSPALHEGSGAPSREAEAGRALPAQPARRPRPLQRARARPGEGRIGGDEGASRKAGFTSRPSRPISTPTASRSSSSPAAPTTPRTSASATAPVRTVLISTEPTTLECNPTGSFSIEPDDLTSTSTGPPAAER